MDFDFPCLYHQMTTWWVLILVQAIYYIIPFLIIFLKDEIVFSCKIAVLWNGVKVAEIVDLKDFILPSQTSCIITVINVYHRDIWKSSYTSPVRSSLRD